MAHAMAAVAADTLDVLRHADTLADTFKFEHVFTRDHTDSLQDNYEVSQAQLGEGSFGSVFKAKSRHTGQVRAVKAMDRKKVTKNKTRFDREIAIQRQLNHPNVVRLYETFQDDAKFYLVMELCTGGELFDHIVSEGASGFDETKVATYMQHILSALCYIHSQRIAHRDVKPENFLLSSEEPGADIKIIDFGLAAEIGPRPLQTKAGTAYYVAPEVLKGGYDERCDVWSAGVISYILLCGFPPFSGDTDEETLRAVRQGVFEFKSPEWDEVSDGAKNIITQMLTVEPKLRPVAEYLCDAPWLRYTQRTVETPVRQDLVNRLSCFQAHCRLKRVVLTIVAQQLPDSAVAPLKAVFQELDINKDGKLTPEEIREGLKKHKLAVPRMLDEILKKVDTDGNGELDYTEFLAATVDKQLYLREDMLQSAFAIFDQNGDGKISCEELTKVLAGNDDARALKIKAMIDEVDGIVDGQKDGEIDFDEFKKMMTEPSRSWKSTKLEPSDKRLRTS